MFQNYRGLIGALILVSAFVLVLSCFAGCAMRESKDLVVGDVGGDMWIRSIGSDNQCNGNDHVFHQEGVSVGASAETPGIVGTQIPPIKAAFNSTGMFAGHSVRIEHVSGSVYIEEAANRNQGITIPETLGKLYKPGDPFAVSEP